MGGRRCAVGVGIVVFAAWLAGCGSPPASVGGGRGAGADDPAHRLAAAARLAGSTGFRTTVTSRLTTAGGQTSQLRVAGAYRPGDHPAADLRRTGADRAAPPELRLIGGTLYLRYGNVMRPGGGGKPWARVTATTSSVSLRRTLHAVERGMAGRLLRMAATSHDVHRAGTATAGGVPTTHYAGTFHPADAITAAGTAGRPSLRDLTPFPRLRFDAWLDGAGHPRKLVVTGKDGGRRYALIQTFSGFGASVHVTAPPRTKVQDGDGPVLPHAPRR